MNVITKDEVMLNKKKIVKQIKQGAVFIHPTDTIYGIGCSVIDKDAVKTVRNVKKRNFMPFSVFAPSKDWIFENCKVSNKAEEWIEKLPGPYTLILALKNKDAVVPEVNNNLNTIGVRIPDHWFREVVSELDTPIVTTSANIKGDNFMTCLDNLNPKIKSTMSFIVYEGEKQGKPSTLVDLSKKEPKIIHRS
ncbi:MAG: Threonylcarbamoyl-AMP synthase [Candidatus Woesearchaeota archaeon]|nr:Threonylcarbamoyl-AMP synthase [Candidatus Woesearchaeota archaeon]